MQNQVKQFCETRYTNQHYLIDSQEINYFHLKHNSKSLFFF